MRLGPLPFVLAMCLAEGVGMLSFSSFQALIPTFRADWGISNSEAGWISGMYFAGYVAAVPVLSSLTDRVDPRRVLLGSLALGGAASIGFALFAEGFWSALLFRALQGVGLAGTYMPGLKALSDHVTGPGQSRYVAFYTASFGIGAAASYVLAGAISPAFGWDWAFGVNAIGSALAAAIIVAVLPPTPPSGEVPQTRLLDFRPVLRNRTAMGFILAYCGHNWELFAVRSWIVAFLVFAAARNPGSALSLDPTVIAALLTLLGVPASVLGNEAAVRLGRLRLITLITLASVGLSLVLGAASEFSYALVVVLALIYGGLLTGDSAAITAGSVGAAAPGQRGATLGMHAFIGFMGGVFGPATAGMVLDAAGGGETVLGWVLAIAAMGAGSAFALAALLIAQRK